MSSSRDDNKIEVACVCGNEVRIYSPYFEKATRREFVRMATFSNRGQAKFYADEFEDRQREPRQMPPLANP